MIVSDVPGTTRDAIDTVLRARRDDASSSSTRPACGASAASGRGSSTTRSCARSRRAERADVALVLDRRVRGDRRPGSRRRRRRAQGRLLDARRPLEVGRRARSTIEDVRPRARAPPAPAAAVDRRLGEDRPRRRPRCSTRSSELFAKHTCRISTAELNRALGELREARQPPQRDGGERLNLLYGTQTEHAPAALPLLRQRSRPRSRATTATGSRTELRERFELEGVPVSIDFVRRGQ